MKKLFAISAILGLVIISGCSANKTAKKADSPKATSTPVSSVQKEAAEEGQKPGVLVKAPAEIKRITKKDDNTYFSLNILSPNPSFAPDGKSDFFIDKSPMVIGVPVDKDMKAYGCGAGPDGNETSADVLVDTNSMIDKIENLLSKKEGRVTYYFDVEGGRIKAIYEQCLP